jgi:small-conductance mechanosensitive channel/CRP-like cAMP-binding protein
MSLGILIGGFVGMVVLVLLPVLGVAYVSYRRNRTFPLLVLLASGLTLLLGGTSLFLHSEAAGEVSQLARSGLEVAAALSASFFFFTLLDFVIIGECLIERGNRYIPDVVRHLLIGVEVVAAGVLILWLIMGINLVALVALPTVAAAVVGVALKDTLARFFAGVELGKVVKVGDWIATMDKEGVVTHIGMEHIMLKTREQDAVSLPNDSIIGAGVTNYTRPTTTHFCSVYVEAAYRTPPEIVCETLVEAASAAPGVLDDPKPYAMVTAFNESGIQYRVKFPISEYARYPIIESQVRTYVWHAFARRGIEIPFPQRVLHQTIEPLSDGDDKILQRIAGRLSAIDFLAALTQKQVDTLARAARIETYLPGERVVRQGDPGQELFVIVSGKADVRLDQNGLSSVVTTLSAGQFFGEMSLLTGEPRSATVMAAEPLQVIAVGKDALIQVVHEDRRLVEQIGEVVARRHAATTAAKEQLSRDAAALAASSHTRSLVERIQSFLWGPKNN